jgi:hypothetical protein
MPHVYVANWMAAIFMVRLPVEALTEEAVKALPMPFLLDIRPTKTQWIITWKLEESENYDRFGMEDDRGWMARLVPVRDELLRGDLRSLYIGWLVAVAREIMDDEERERIGKPVDSPAGARRISRGGSGSAGRRRHGQSGCVGRGNFATGNG